MTKSTKTLSLMPRLYTMTATKPTAKTKVYSTPVQYATHTTPAWHYQLNH
ncbi:hypothetical protein [Lactiplantibacillus daowaiensis]|uniref:Uncharacterized protein n=1 Tax=Lactiplantibacillus daowaiensis TaxID=2559918 RepID=A0ABW1S0J6_9LACO|nr:hypothetical protein [Lactiplantibacillus daowaiensis]